MENQRTIAWATVLAVVQLLVLNACHYPQNQIHEIGCDVNELIDAINTANSNTVQDTILLQQGCPYTLTEVDNQIDTGSRVSSNGLPAITTPITIKGDRMFPPAIERSSASGTPEFRIFFISSSGELSLDNLHIANGSTQTAGGGIFNNGGQLNLEYVSIHGCTANYGGGIANSGEFEAWSLMLYENSAIVRGEYIAVTGGGLQNSGTATISGGSSIYENLSGKRGGGISTSGTLTLEEVNIYSNSVEEFGGGIYSDGAELSITLSNLEDNSAARDGGGLYSSNSNITIDSSDVRDNQAQSSGGGMHVTGGTLEIRNNTKVRNNNATQGGGGIFTSAETTIDGSLIQNNTAGTGGVVVALGGVHEIRDTVIEGNQASSYGGGIWINMGEVIVSNGSQIVDNNSVSAGGGVYNINGVFSLVDSTILDNQATAGAGIDSHGEVVIKNSTIASNTASDIGGGLRNAGDTTIIDSTVKDNRAENGGGLSTHGAVYATPGTDHLLIVNSTISGNQATDRAGGIYLYGYSGAISFSTIADNDAAEVGGIYNENIGSLEIKNSIVALNSSDNCYSSWMNPTIAIGDNLSNDNSCEGFTLIADPLLGPLAMNGGSTETHALEDGSPAIDVVPSQACTTVDGVDVDEDQRGFRRPGKHSNECDLGAYEALLPGPAPFNPPPPTAFIGKSRMNANCRAGPGTAYNETGFVPEGFTAQIEGRNEESTWLYIQTPNGQDHCWVSTIAIELAFELQTIPVVASQPLPAPVETEPPAETQPPAAQGCTVMQMSGAIKCVVPCPVGAVPGEACTP